MVYDEVIRNTEDIDVILADLNPDDITSILNKSKEVNELKRTLEKLDEMLKMKIKAFLKERGWDRYVDPTSKISVILSRAKREDFDKSQLKLILTDSQYAQVVRVTTFEKLMIITPEAKQRMKHYVMAKKK